MIQRVMMWLVRGDIERNSVCSPSIKLSRYSLMDCRIILVDIFATAIVEATLRTVMKLLRRVSSWIRSRLLTSLIKSSCNLRPSVSSFVMWHAVAKSLLFFCSVSTFLTSAITSSLLSRCALRRCTSRDFQSCPHLPPLAAAIRSFSSLHSSVCLRAPEVSQILWYPGEWLTTSLTPEKRALWMVAYCAPIFSVELTKKAVFQLPPWPVFRS